MKSTRRGWLARLFSLSRPSFLPSPMANLLGDRGPFSLRSLFYHHGLEVVLAPQTVWAREHARQRDAALDDWVLTAARPVYSLDSMPTSSGIPSNSKNHSKSLIRLDTIVFLSDDCQKESRSKTEREKRRKRKRNKYISWSKKKCSSPRFIPYYLLKPACPPPLGAHCLHRKHTKIEVSYQRLAGQ